MKRQNAFFFIVAILIGLLLTAIRPALASGGIQPVFQPRFGWSVCEDLGSGPVPGLGIVRQRFALCTADGWELLTYCLEPNKEPPALGTICSQTSSGDYWCGDDVQILRRYAVAATPRPRTATATRRPTITTTATRRPTIAATRTQPVSRPSSTPLPTVIGPRPRPGGPGNLGWLVIFGASVTGLIVVQTLLFLAIRRR